MMLLCGLLVALLLTSQCLCLGQTSTWKHGNVDKEHGTPDAASSSRWLVTYNEEHAINVIRAVQLLGGTVHATFSSHNKGHSTMVFDGVPRHPLGAPGVPVLANVPGD